jgi:hypothetical protein
LVGEGGFEPSKSMMSHLQCDAFNRTWLFTHFKQPISCSDSFAMSQLNP